MSYAPLNWAMQQELSASKGKGVLIALAYRASTGYCFPSLATIAKDSGNSEKTVRRHLTQLEQLGLIEIYTRYSDAFGYGPDGYRLTGVTTGDEDILEALHCDHVELKAASLPAEAGQFVPMAGQSVPPSGQSVPVGTDNLSQTMDNLSQSHGQFVPNDGQFVPPSNIDITSIEHQLRTSKERQVPERSLRELAHSEVSRADATSAQPRSPSQASGQIQAAGTEELAPDANKVAGACKKSLGKARSKRATFDAEADEVVEKLPADLPADTWRAWVAHRRAIRKPLTEQAVALQLRKLADCPSDPTAVLELSISNGWTGIFPDKAGLPRRQATVQTSQQDYSKWAKMSREDYIKILEQAPLEGEAMHRVWN